MLYFGVRPGDTAGHFVYDQNFARVRDDEALPVTRAALDGGLIPPAERRLYVAHETVVDGIWRIFSWRDHTGDARPGSVSVLIGSGDAGSGWYLEEGRRAFPAVFARLDKAGVVLRLYDYEAETAGRTPAAPA